MCCIKTKVESLCSQIEGSQIYQSVFYILPPLHVPAQLPEELPCDQDGGLAPSLGTYRTHCYLSPNR